MVPKAISAASPRRSTAASSETSVVTAMAVPPLAAISLVTASRSAVLRAASTTRAPRLAAIRAVARPMPLDAPVMTMTCCFRDFGRSFFMPPFASNPRAGGQSPLPYENVKDRHVVAGLPRAAAQRAGAEADSARTVADHRVQGREAAEDRRLHAALLAGLERQAVHGNRPLQPGAALSNLAAR